MAVESYNSAVARDDSTMSVSGWITLEFSEQLHISPSILHSTRNNLELYSYFSILVSLGHPRSFSLSSDSVRGHSNLPFTNLVSC